MKWLHLFLGFAWVFIALAIIITKVLPTLFVIVLMCIIISSDSFEAYFREKKKVDK